MANGRPRHPRRVPLVKDAYTGFLIGADQAVQRQGAYTDEADVDEIGYREVDRTRGRRHPLLTQRPRRRLPKSQYR